MRRWIALMALVSAVVLAAPSQVLADIPPGDGDDRAPELMAGDFVLGPEEAITYDALTDVRCKLQRFTVNFKQANLFTAIKYEGMFRVCYRPGQSIVSWSDIHGDATYNLLPWEWRGNDSGYRYGVKVATDVVQSTPGARPRGVSSSTGVAPRSIRG